MVRIRARLWMGHSGGTRKPKAASLYVTSKAMSELHCGVPHFLAQKHGRFFNLLEVITTAKSDKCRFLSKQM